MARQTDLEDTEPRAGATGSLASGSERWRFRVFKVGLVCHVRALWFRESAGCSLLSAEKERDASFQHAELVNESARARRARRAREAVDAEPTRRFVAGCAGYEAPSRALSRLQGAVSNGFTNP